MHIIAKFFAPNLKYMLQFISTMMSPCPSQRILKIVQSISKTSLYLSLVGSFVDNLLLLISGHWKSVRLSDDGSVTFCILLATSTFFIIIF